ncbi:GntR family transcriptional regulator [Maritimibacter sp. 55A14]|uniref:GntR family transcriptional regulator n=1 Tax=Maritimibacter sp. 55A14 TaxID=2174844 RepID=UPI000D60861D|nr:GntR family transcriptional regulator [Maritimibacter sp. 55A14]PWE31439.1 GntR family transcriptional regulator [Maritimibacter sp. 55A14]
MSIGDKLSPVAESFTLKDHTFKVLRAAILDMDIYRPDADLRLDERMIAERLGVSRTPIREALARLAQEGLVEIVPRKGVFVRRKTREEILEMVVTWAALESMAARLATENATDDQIKALRKFAMKHSTDVARADLEEYSDANITFHQTILELSGCALLRTTADGLFTHMQAVRRRAMGENDRARRSVVDHMSIIEALAARDADQASRRVREHTMLLHDHISKTWTRLESLRGSGDKAS